MAPLARPLTLRRKAAAPTGRYPTMLEPDIRDVYQRMADVDLPPSRISIPEASRRGRAQLRMRRAGAISTPLFAAGAVLAIALSGVLVQTDSAGLNVAGSRGAAPRYFDPLRP